MRYIEPTTYEPSYVCKSLIHGSGNLIPDKLLESLDIKGDLALTSGTGLRFAIDLEKAKEACQIGKALAVLQTLGAKLTLTPPLLTEAR